MAAANLLCRHAAAELVGATYSLSSGSVLTTIQGDGVKTYDLDQKQLGSLPLGSRSTLEFQVASVQHSEPTNGREPRLSIVASVVHERSSKTHTLCLHDSITSSRAISDAPSRVALPGPAHSCHFLHRQQQTAAEAGPSGRHPTVAVVLMDGRVGTAELGSDPVSQLNLLASGQQSSPRHLLAASTHDTLVVISQQAAGGPVALRVVRLPAADAGALAPIKTLSLPCPGASAGAHAVPTGLTTSSSFALVQWSNGYATAVHGIHPAAAPLRPSNFPLADSLGANGASSSAPAAATPAGASGRKRKVAAADGPGGAGTRPRVLCAAVDDRQFVVLDLESAAAQSQVCYSLHDAQFGCPLSSGAVEVDAPLLSLEAGQCAVVGAGPEATVLRLGGAVHVLHIRTQPVSLLSLVARLSVSAAAAAASSGAAGAAGQPKAKQAGTGGRGVAAALVALPTPVLLDPGLLSGQPPGVSAAAAAAAAAATASASDDMSDVVLQPVPAAAVSRLEDICNSLIDQLAAVVPPAAPPQALLESAVSYVAGRRQHAMAVPPQLLSLAARGLAATKQWSQLGTLLSHVPQGGLTGCSDVLVAVAAAQQYPLLPRLATCLDEVDPGSLVSVLQQLLAPTTRANLAQRQQHYQALRAAAESRVAEAEQATGGAPALAAKGRPGARGGSDPASALALAQCAAAVVDGFSFREVLLHPLIAIPVDSPAVQVALWRLSGSAADSLLAYLAKWVVKYTGGAIGDVAASLALPQELLFPYYHQVLDWTRMTIDSHLTRLLMARAPLPALESLESALNNAMEGAKRLMLLRGALEHMHAAAPLPAAHIAVASQYTAEVLDLRVR